jgi:hypothetical protein
MSEITLPQPRRRKRIKQGMKPGHSVQMLVQRVPSGGWRYGLIIYGQHFRHGVRKTNALAAAAARECVLDYVARNAACQPKQMDYPEKARFDACRARSHAKRRKENAERGVRSDGATENTPASTSNAGTQRPGQ